MADSKSAGRWAVWVRVPLRVQGRLGALTGSAERPRAGFCCGERAFGWLLPSPPWQSVRGVVGKGGTCCFMCVVGVVVLWGLRLLGCGWCDNLILAEVAAILMVRDGVVASSKDSKHSLRERPMWVGV